MNISSHILALLVTVSAASAAPPFAERPDDAGTVAWLRFVDGEETYEGVPYLWLGRGDLRLSFEVAPEPSHSIELLWGSKGDQRRAILLVNGESVRLEGGGHRGFRWLRVPLPDGLKGERYDVTMKPADGREAFLAEVRLIGPKRGQTPPDLRASAHKARLLARPSNATPASVPREAFPEMRPFWDREPATTAANSPQERLFRQAEQNARIAAEALFRCQRYVDGWLAHADPKTGLIPRNLGQHRDLWNGRDSGADNYPYMVLTCALTDRPMFEGRMLDMLRTEERVTRRLDRLGDQFLFSKQGFAHEQLDFDRLAFDNAEYVKDGLIPLTEWLGPSPWSERMVGLIEDIWKHAPVETPFGKIPTLNFEVNGDLLQACSRIYWFTGESKFLDWAIRLGDFYLLGTNHPTRDFEKLRFSDHDCEVINGLSELYVAVAHARPEKKQAYQKPIHALYDRMLESGRNEDGLLWHTVNPKTGANNGALCDTWGYNYDGVYTAFLIDGVERYRDAVRHVLAHLGPKYHGRPWADKSQDGIADSVEGALNLYNREAVPAAAAWIDHQMRVLWDCQQPDGTIERWHGDGNFARTTIMYALWKSQGVTVQPRRPDVRIGAVRSDDGQLHLSLRADQPWAGRVLFDRPRHRDYLHLPLDYPRINQFPEWFTVRAGAKYVVRDAESGTASQVTGEELQQGRSVQLQPGVEARWVVDAGK